MNFGMIKLTAADALVTTPVSASTLDKELAADLADRLGSVFYTRGKNTISDLARSCRVKAAVVVSSEEIHLVYQGQRYGFHPNMALHRVLSLKKGDRDRLVQAADLKAGDSFLDCTCGLGADAVVAAYTAGKQGKVQALEASPLLSTIVWFGLGNYRHKEGALVEAMGRIAVVNADYARYLPELETNSWDVVYFDPMFEKTFSATKSMDLVHILGSDSLPTFETIKQARRVARRSVVIKDRYPGNFLKSMDVPIISNVKRILYGRLKAF